MYGLMCFPIFQDFSDRHLCTSSLYNKTNRFRTYVCAAQWHFALCRFRAQAISASSAIVLCMKKRLISIFSSFVVESNAVPVPSGLFFFLIYTLQLSRVSIALKWYT